LPNWKRSIGKKSQNYKLKKEMHCMKRVLVSDTLSTEGIEVLKQTPDIEVDVMTNLTPDELRGVIKEYDGLVIRSATKVTQAIIDSAENLKVIGRAGVGLDNVDILAASKRGIGRQYHHDGRACHLHDVVARAQNPPGNRLHEKREMGKEQIHGKRDF
jgi:hypothetical protein